MEGESRWDCAASTRAPRVGHGINWAIKSHESHVNTEFEWLLFVNKNKIIWRLMIYSEQWPQRSAGRLSPARPCIRTRPPVRESLPPIHRRGLGPCRMRRPTRFDRKESFQNQNNGSGFGCWRWVFFARCAFVVWFSCSRFRRPQMSSMSIFDEG